MVKALVIYRKHLQAWVDGVSGVPLWRYWRNLSKDRSELIDRLENKGEDVNEINKLIQRYNEALSQQNQGRSYDVYRWQNGG